MRSSQQETMAYTKSRQTQHTVKPQQETVDTQSFLPSQGYPLARTISRMGSVPSASSHAAMLNRSPAAGQSSNRQVLLQLQQQYGNGYVNQVVHLAQQMGRETQPSLMHQPLIQAQLTIGAVGNKYKQEANSVARQVGSRISQPRCQHFEYSKCIQRQEIPQEEELPRKPKADKRPNQTRILIPVSQKIQASQTPIIQLATSMRMTSDVIATLQPVENFQVLSKNQQDVNPTLEGWFENPQATDAHRYIIGRIQRNPNNRMIAVARNDQGIQAIATYDEDNDQSKIFIYNIISNPTRQPGAARAIIASLGIRAKAYGSAWSLFLQAKDDQAANRFEQMGFVRMSESDHCLIL